jgi:hypothetical protein
MPRTHGSPLSLAGVLNTSHVRLRRPPHHRVPRATRDRREIHLAGISDVAKVNDFFYRGTQPNEEGVEQLKKLGLNIIVGVLHIASTRKPADSLVPADGVATVAVDAASCSDCSRQSAPPLQRRPCGGPSRLTPKANWNACRRRLRRNW